MPLKADKEKKNQMKTKQNFVTRYFFVANIWSCDNHTILKKLV